MFSIHGATGKVFTGTLEEVNRVHPLSRSNRTRVTSRENEDSAFQADPGATSRRNEEAVRAYRAMLPREVERGPLYDVS